MMRENFTHPAVYLKIEGIIHWYFSRLPAVLPLAPALLKRNSEIRLTVVVIPIRFAACPRIKKQNEVRTKNYETTKKESVHAY